MVFRYVAFCSVFQAFPYFCRLWWTFFRGFVGYPAQKHTPFLVIGTENTVMKYRFSHLSLRGLSSPQTDALRKPLDAYLLQICIVCPILGCRRAHESLAGCFVFERCLLYRWVLYITTISLYRYLVGFFLPSSALFPTCNPCPLSQVPLNIVRCFYAIGVENAFTLLWHSENFFCFQELFCWKQIRNPVSLLIAPTLNST